MSTEAARAEAERAVALASGGHFIRNLVPGELRQIVAIVDNVLETERRRGWADPDSDPVGDLRRYAAAGDPVKARPDPTDPERPLLRWRRWWITYDVGPRPDRCRAGPYLTRRTAAAAADSIWRDKPLPPHMLIVQEPRR